MPSSPTDKGSSSSSSSSSSQPPPRLFKFPSHQSHTLHLARMCRENNTFADCVIQTDDADSSSQLRAHRLVLGAASGFLRSVFAEMPPSLPEANVLVPGVRQEVVRALLDFLYTGEMRVERRDTADLQLLIHTLQIDPDLITVEEKDTEERDAEETDAEAKCSKERDCLVDNDAEEKVETREDAENTSETAKGGSDDEDREEKQAAEVEQSKRKRKAVDDVEEAFDDKKKK